MEDGDAVLEVAALSPTTFAEKAVASGNCRALRLSWGRGAVAVVAAAAIHRSMANCGPGSKVRVLAVVITT